MDNMEIDVTLTAKVKHVSGEKNGSPYDLYLLSLDVPFGDDFINLSLRAPDFMSGKILQSFLKNIFKKEDKK